MLINVMMMIVVLVFFIIIDLYSAKTIKYSNALDGCVLKKTQKGYKGRELAFYDWQQKQNVMMDDGYGKIICACIYTSCVCAISNF